MDIYKKINGHFVHTSLYTDSLYFSHHWQASDEEVESALNEALEAGYRHIDTAPVYLNEKTIGKVLKEWLEAGKLTREELFIVTKLPPHGTYNHCTDMSC